MNPPDPTRGTRDQGGNTGLGELNQAPGITAVAVAETSKQAYGAVDRGGWSALQNTTKRDGEITSGGTWAAHRHKDMERMTAPPTVESPMLEEGLC